MNGENLMANWQDVINNQYFDAGFQDVWSQVKAGVNVDQLAFGLTQRLPAHHTEESRHYSRGQWAAIKEARK